MIDYIKLSTSSVPFARSVIENCLLKDSWSNFTREQTGNRISFAYYQGMRFKVYSTGRIEIDGSLHKYFNGGSHNFNDFTYSGLVFVLTDLSEKFGLEILTAKVENLEYGININTPFNPNEFINRIIVYLKKGARLKHSITKDDSKGFDKGIKFILGQYMIKVYNKGKQYGQDENILRCEFKTVKMEVIGAIGVSDLFDVLDKPKLHQLHQKLVASYEDILIHEIVDTNKLSKVELRIYLECVNPEYWRSIDRDKRARRKEQFKELIRSKAETDFKSIVLDLIEQKYNDLRGARCKSANILTDTITGHNKAA